MQIVSSLWFVLPLILLLLLFPPRNTRVIVTEHWRWWQYTKGVWRMYYITLYKAPEMFLFVWRLVIVFITENAMEVSGTGRRKRNRRQQSRKEDFPWTGFSLFTTSCNLIFSSAWVIYWEVLFHADFLIRFKSTLYLFHSFGTYTITVSFPFTLLSTHHQNRNYLLDGYRSVKFHLKGHWKGTQWLSISIHDSFP